MVEIFFDPFGSARLVCGCSRLPVKILHYYIGSGNIKVWGNQALYYLGDVIMKSLFDQLGETELSVVATLVGTTSDHVGFRMVMRNIKPLPSPFKMGHAVVAYGKYLQDRFCEYSEV